MLYLSRYIIDTKNDYYRLLLAVTADQSWEEWVIYILTGIEVTSRYTLRKVAAIRQLQDDFYQRARAASRAALTLNFSQCFSSNRTVALPP